MNCVTDISGIEKVYSTGEMHHVQAPVVYGFKVSADGPLGLYADKEQTEPVSYKLLKSLFLAGAIIYRVNGNHVNYVTLKSFDEDPVAGFAALSDNEDTIYVGYDADNNNWYPDSI